MVFNTDGTADAGNSIVMTITDTTQLPGGAIAFTYDISYNGYANDSGLVGLKRGNIMTFNISYTNGYSIIIAKTNQAGNRALYSDAFVSDRYCEYSGTGSIYVCEFYVAEVTSLNNGTISK